MNRYQLLSLSVSGGILTGLAWTSWFPGLILLVAFVPFFLIENHIFENPGRFYSNAFFFYILPGIIIFNTMTLGWVRAASIPAAITVVTGMSFLMAFILWLAHSVRVRAGIATASLMFILTWLSFELLSLNFVLLTPWNNLGNGLAKDILFIQWYEITGTSGGTLWILLSNLLLTFFLVNLFRQNRRYYKFLWIWLAVILVPPAISMTRFYTVRQDGTREHEVLIVQPNIDPFTEKFSIPFEVQLEKTLNMAARSVTHNTDWLITPETTVDDPVNEEDMTNNKYILAFREFAGHQPGVNIVTGMVSYRLYPPGKEAPTNSARKIDSSGYFYDHFNSAFMIDSFGVTEIYHKSKLVPGIEMQFSAGFGRLIGKIVPYLGGTKWGYGIQKERTCFEHRSTGQVAAPIICYESVFGNYVADYVRNGAGTLFIITNDGWWKNTSGYKQHLSYASIRAIETRRPVARAANTGISCFIDIRGKRTQETQWWSEAVLRGDIGSETTMTPYVLYGDYLMRFSAVLNFIILAYVFIALPIRKKLWSYHQKSATLNLSSCLYNQVSS